MDFSSTSWQAKVHQPFQISERGSPLEVYPLPAPHHDQQKHHNYKGGP